MTTPSIEGKHTYAVYIVTFNECHHNKKPTIGGSVLVVYIVLSATSQLAIIMTNRVCPSISLRVNFCEGLCPSNHSIFWLNVFMDCCLVPGTSYFLWIAMPFGIWKLVSNKHIFFAQILVKQVVQLQVQYYRQVKTSRPSWSTCTLKFSSCFWDGQIHWQVTWWTVVNLIILDISHILTITKVYVTANLYM